MEYPRSIRVFLVDGRADRRSNLEEQLSLDEDLDLVGSAGDGAEALGWLRHEQADVVLMDTTMPRLDGLTMLRVLRSAATVPVVVLADKPEVESVLDALSLGAVGYLPIDDQNGFPSASLAGHLRHLLRASEAIPCVTLDRDGHSDADVQIIGAGIGEVAALATHLRTVGGSDARSIFGLLDSPDWFIAPLAHRLHRSTPWRVLAAAVGDHLAPGHALLASVGQGLLPMREGGRIRVIKGQAWRNTSEAISAILRDHRLGVEEGATSPREKGRAA